MMSQRPSLDRGEAHAATTDRMATLCLSILICLAASIVGCQESQRRPSDWTGRSSVPVRSLVPQASQILQQALVDENPYIRVNAIEVVATTKQIKLMPKVERLLRDEFVPVRFAAALAIGDMGYSLGRNSLRLVSQDPDENVRIAACYALAKLGSPKHLEPVINAVASKDLTVRANAALLLGKSGNASSTKFLYWTMQREGSDDRVRYQAAESIAMLGDDRVVPKIWTMLISAYADVRVIGIRAMGALGTPEARNALITMLDDDVLEVRLAAAEQLGALNDSIGEPQVLDVFKKNITAGMDPAGRERVNVRAALAIGQIGTPRLTGYLPTLLTDQSKSVQLAAAMAVFESRMAK